MDGARNRCALCVAVRDAATSTPPFPYNRNLLETDQFVVLPSLGPLVPGHVMVVSKSHRYSLASMGKAAVDEYESLAARLRTAPFLREGIPLEAEHGSAVDDKAGACVIHTHVHWVPGMGHFLGDFKERLPLLPEIALLGVGNLPYIFARAGAEPYVFDAKGLRSQTIRRILCDLLDRDDTDWTQAPRIDWVEKTVDAWLRERIWTQTL